MPKSKLPFQEGDLPPKPHDRYSNAQLLSIENDPVVLLETLTPAYLRRLAASEGHLRPAIAAIENTQALTTSADTEVTEALAALLESMTCTQIPKHLIKVSIQLGFFGSAAEFATWDSDLRRGAESLQEIALRVEPVLRTEFERLAAIRLSVAEAILGGADSTRPGSQHSKVEAKEEHPIRRDSAIENEQASGHDLSTKAAAPDLACTQMSVAALLSESEALPWQHQFQVLANRFLAGEIDKTEFQDKALEAVAGGSAVDQAELLMVLAAYDLDEHRDIALASVLPLLTEQEQYTFCQFMYAHITSPSLLIRYAHCPADEYLTANMLIKAITLDSAAVDLVFNKSRSLGPVAKARVNAFLLEAGHTAKELLPEVLHGFRVSKSRDEIISMGEVAIRLAMSGLINNPEVFRGLLPSDRFYALLGCATHSSDPTAIFELITNKKQLATELVAANQNLDFVYDTLLHQIAKGQSQLLLALAATQYRPAECIEIALICENTWASPIDVMNHSKRLQQTAPDTPAINERAIYGGIYWAISGNQPLLTERAFQPVRRGMAT